LHRSHQLVKLADDGLLVQSAYLVRPLKPFGGGVIHHPDPPQDILVDRAISCRHCLDVCDCLVQFFTDRTMRFTHCPAPFSTVLTVVLMISPASALATRAPGREPGESLGEDWMRPPTLRSPRNVDGPSPAEGPFPSFGVQASVKAPESCAWSTRSEGGRRLARPQPRRKSDRAGVPNMCWTCGSAVSRWWKTSGGEM